MAHQGGHEMIVALGVVGVIPQIIQLSTQNSNTNPLYKAQRMDATYQLYGIDSSGNPTIIATRATGIFL